MIDNWKNKSVNWIPVHFELRQARVYVTIGFGSLEDFERTRLNLHLISGATQAYAQTQGSKHFDPVHDPAQAGAFSFKLRVMRS